MAEREEIIGGRYRVKSLIGEGGTAKVYLVEDEGNGREYALKEILRKDAQKAGGALLVRTKERLFHPGLIHLWRAWEEKGKLYFLMDYVKGRNLDEVLRERGALPQEMAVDIAMQLCKALVYLHGFQPPLIYRDMKPGNIILQADGKIKLIDLGAARELQKKHRHDTVPLGTPGYAAPEQFGSRARSDVRSDVYAVGVTLYHMLTGHDPGEPPYEIGRIREWNQGLSPSLERIVIKCTKKWPSFRYQNCETLLKALEEYQQADRKLLKAGFHRFLEKKS